jgi:hypothetical protein
MSVRAHVCERGGVLVSGTGFIPDDAADFVWTPAARALGCGRIICTACGEQVAAASPDPDGGRSYRCRCSAFVAHVSHWLDGQPDDGPSGRVPSSWRCAGHAPRALPAELDGVRVDAQPDWRAMLVSSVDGRFPARTPAWLPDAPNAWLERLVATLDDAERRRFTDMVCALVDDAHEAMRRAGLELAERLGLEGVTSALVERVARGELDWTRDEHLAAFAIEQIRRAAVRVERPDERLRAALRLALMSGHGGPLLFAAGRHDVDWLADHAVAVTRGMPRGKTRVLNALADHPEAAARAKRFLEQPAPVDMGLRARWVLVDAPPGAGTDACAVRLGFESTEGAVQVLGDVIVSPCQNLEDALATALKVIAELGLPLGPVFSLIYPHYPVSGPLEAEMHRIAWAIKDAADARGWEFRRDMPLAKDHIRSAP